MFWSLLCLQTASVHAFTTSAVERLALLGDIEGHGKPSGINCWLGRVVLSLDNAVVIGIVF